MRNADHDVASAIPLLSADLTCTEYYIEAWESFNRQHRLGNLEECQYKQ